MGSAGRQSRCVVPDDFAPLCEAWLKAVRRGVQGGGKHAQNHRVKSYFSGLQNQTLQSMYVHVVNNQNNAKWRFDPKHTNSTVSKLTDQRNHMAIVPI